MLPLVDDELGMIVQLRVTALAAAAARAAFLLRADLHCLRTGCFFFLRLSGNLRPEGPLTNLRVSGGSSSSYFLFLRFLDSRLGREGLLFVSGHERRPAHNN